MTKNLTLSSVEVLVHGRVLGHFLDVSLSISQPGQRGVVSGGTYESRGRESSNATFVSYKPHYNSSTVDSLAEKEAIVLRYKDGGKSFRLEGSIGRDEPWENLKFTGGGPIED